MSANYAPLRQGNSADLARICLEHLQRERTHLEAMKDLLGQTHAVLLSADPAGLTFVVQQQQQVAETTEKLRHDRVRFREDIAQVWQVQPAMVTLPWLAVILGDEMGQRLLQERQSLQRLSAEVGRLVESNASLMYYCLDFLNRFFGDLMGGQTSGCYGPVGTLQEARCGSIIEARG